MVSVFNISLVIHAKGYFCTATVAWLWYYDYVRKERGKTLIRVFPGVRRDFRCTTDPSMAYSSGRRIRNR